MKTLGKYLISLVTLVAMIAAFQFIWFKDWLITGMVVTSIVLHEIGHATVLLSYGVSSSMFFVPFLGAVVVPNKKVNTLSDKQNALVSLAGPLVNVVLVMIGLILLITKYSGIQEKYPLGLVSLNLSLIFFNMLPFLPFDGGRYVRF